MISPDQVERLQDQLDRFIAVLVAGALIFIVGGTMAVFASQEFATGTDFMMCFAGAEQALGLLLILVGWIKVHLLSAELHRHVPPQLSTQAMRAGSGS
jgi:predicted ribosomally synthesized peptide with SipW-like signal peptide